VSVKFALLGLLAEKPCHGYELHAAFEALVGGDSYWDLKPAQVYSTLERLREAMLVECASDLGQGNEPSRRIYALTPQGYQALDEWYTCGILPEHQRDEFYIKLMVSLVSGYGDPYRILITQRSFIYQRMHAVTNQRNELDSQVELAQVLLLDKSIMYLEADLRWLDMIEARLDDIMRQPKPRPEIRPRGRPKKIAG
jgi:DNA-binding PadR family transcriptional regulator